MSTTSQPEFDLKTSEGGRGYVAHLFTAKLKRHDFTRYIKERLAADFACTLAAHLAQTEAAAPAREAALQEELAELNRAVTGIINSRGDLQLRLNASEARNAELERGLNQAYMALIGYLPRHRNDVTDAAIEACRLLTQSAPVTYEQDRRLEALAKSIYGTCFSDLPGFVPWVDGGNSVMQGKARDQARKTLEGEKHEQ